VQAGSAYDDQETGKTNIFVLNQSLYGKSSFKHFPETNSTAIK
jgi:hypothetical protein